MKPNIIFLTVGCSNSSVVTRMIEAMGWHLGNIRPEFAEHKELHRINYLASWKRRPFNLSAAKSLLATLPQPWVLKDPKFCETLKHWMPLFEPYRPLLFWLTKRMDYVEQSYQRRFPGEFKPGYASRRYRWCQSYFADWPYAKLQMDVDQIAAAVRLFDPDRIYSNGHKTG